MQPPTRSADIRQAAPDGGPLSVHIDPLVQKRAEGVARARGTTLSHLMQEYVHALADSDQWPRSAWLENAHSVFWSHLEKKHR